MISKDRSKVSNLHILAIIPIFIVIYIVSVIILIKTDDCRDFSCFVTGFEIPYIALLYTIPLSLILYLWLRLRNRSFKTFVKIAFALLAIYLIFFYMPAL